LDVEGYNEEESVDNNSEESLIQQSLLDAVLPDVELERYLFLIKILTHRLHIYYKSLHYTLQVKSLCKEKVLES
jgi:hypothetical protein